MHPVLADVAGPQILPQHQRADARVDEHAALDRRLVDAAGAEMPQMLDLRDVGARVEPEEPIVERRSQCQGVWPAIAGVIELGHGGEHVAERPLDRRPVAAIELLAAVMRQEAGKPEIRLAAVDELLLAVGDRLGGVLRRGQIERLTIFEIPGNPPNAETKRSPQHRHRNGAPHDRAGFVGRGLAAVIVVTGLDGGQAGAERPLQLEKPPAGKPVARGLGRGLVDLPPDRVRQMRLPAIEVVHRLGIPQ